MKTILSYGINPQASLMYPCSKEVSQVLTVCHGGAVIVYGMKYKQSEKSKKPFSEGIAQALSAGCHDASVVMLSPRLSKKKKQRQ